MRKSNASNAATVVAEPISLREAARRLGVTLYAVQKRVQAGTLTALPSRKLDWSTVQSEWTQNRDISKVRKAPVSIQVARNFLAAKTKREYLRVAREALELRRLRGELAPLGEVNAFVAGMIIRAREILTAMAGQLKDRLAQQAEPSECEALIAGEVQRALAELREFHGQTTTQKKNH